MPTTKPSSGSSGSVGTEVAKGIGGLLLIAAAVYFVHWLVVKILWIWGKVVLGFFTAGKIAVCIGALTILSFIVALICDALTPLVLRMAKDRKTRRAMGQSRLPALTTFQTGKSTKEDEVGKVDAFMASLLRTRFRELTGSVPDRSTFRNNQSAYAAFKAGELPNALISARHQIESELFSPLVAAYRAGDCHQIGKEDQSETEKISDVVRLRAFVDRSLDAEKQRHPLRCTGRLLNVLSFGRFGIPAGGGYKKMEAKDSGTDSKALMSLLWGTYWTALPDIASLYENGIELPEEQDEDDDFPPTPQLECVAPEYRPPVLMLPAPSGPEFIPETDDDVIPPEPLPVIDEKALSRQAEEAANQALLMFQGDHPRWSEPVALLNDIEATLIAVSPHHPDKASLYERLAFVRDCRHHLDSFTEDFDCLMNTVQSPDDAWDAPWLAQGSQDLFQQQLMPTPENLYRASLPHYLVEKWKIATDGEADKGTCIAVETNTTEHLSAALIDNPVKPFRGSATDTESGF